ncbi:MAG: hypothetical protein JXQ96_08060 [Cyclobacteriaceae bacterium]
MTKIGLILIGFFIVVSSALAGNKMEPIAYSDTVYIDLGENRKVAIVVDDPEDLKELEKRDLNKMISKLRKHSEDVLEKKEDVKKDKNLKDTTYYFSHKKADIDFSIANYKIEIQSDDFDDLGDDIEDFFEHYDDAEKEEVIEKDVPKHKKSFDIDLGVNNWIENGGIANDNLYGVKPWGSWYIAFKRMHRTHTGGRGFINWGYGISWYNWKFENRNTRLIKGENSVVFSEDNSVDGLKSKLTASFLNIELIPTIDYSHGRRKMKTVRHGNVKVTKYRKEGLRLGLGPYLGYRLGAKTKIVYKVSGDKRKDKDHDNFYLNNLRYGLRAKIGFNRTDFFINYDLNKVFVEGKGPSLNAISFGFTL